ncbi:MAG: bifunctional lysine ketoglutarate reductase /saccharopine dehydrogenase family protein [Candidatus Eremiobacteraeota bacterium]|nr:bifunctional lysine ketoglutarate reductase /saccharopine dehydrogenase family protein [Candidatus Eremiobacteraeota bacterium]
MKHKIGIRREDKNQWERRAPLSPEQIQHLIEKDGLEVIVQPSPIRVFPDEAYGKAGATIDEDLSRCSVVIGIKEIPPSLLHERTTYIFFSHTIKGQSHNMPMLRRLRELRCQVIDFELIKDENDRRLIFFGYYAGLAGMIDMLWALGQRLLWEGMDTPFKQILPAHKYANLEEARRAIIRIADLIGRDGLPESLVPLVCGFTGYGRVSQGAQEIYDLLPVQEIPPSHLPSLFERASLLPNILFKTVFREENTVEPVWPDRSFDLQDYYRSPEHYRSRFSRFLPSLTVIANCIYWEPRYPKLITKKDMKDLYESEKTPRLRVIGDISCDVDGAIEATVKYTTPSSPVFVYNPETGEATDGWEGRGPVVLAVDNLPCELPVESSRMFGEVLLAWVPHLARADYEGPVEGCELPLPVKKALILYKGEFTEAYRHMEDFLKEKSH